MTHIWARQSNREIFERAELSRRFNLDLEIASRARSDLTDETQYVFSTRSVRAGHSNFTMYLRASSPQSYILIHRRVGRARTFARKKSGTFLRRDETQLVRNALLVVSQHGADARSSDASSACGGVRWGVHGAGWRHCSSAALRHCSSAPHDAARGWRPVEPGRANGPPEGALRPQDEASLC